MIRLEGLQLPMDYDEENLRGAICRKLRIKKDEINGVELLREAVDARKKPKLKKVVSVGVTLGCGETAVAAAYKGVARIEQPLSYDLSENHYSGAYPPLVVGMGPAGLFGALVLARAGLKPLVIEAGRSCQRRRQDILGFCDGGAFLEQSNIQFGVGGAGMFSDGKLTTGTKDIRHREILQTMIRCGAPREIAYLAKPHIGSDRLPGMSRGLTAEIEAAGGRLLYETRLIDIVTRKGKLAEVILADKNGERRLPCDRLLLATGHSARETVTMLWQRGAVMTQKPFSVGVRIEHLQRDVNLAQYGEGWESLAADYKLAVHLKNGRSVYTFCMCPGGMVVPATSEENAVVTNGMSEWARDGVNANSALLVNVKPDDFPDEGALSGIDFQRDLERKSFILGGRTYAAPAQRVEDFLIGRPSTAWGKVLPSYRPGVRMCDINPLFPDYITDSLKEALPLLGRKLKGFDDGDAVLTAAETRSSAPYRLCRDENGESSIGGLYPAGEGSGYAGGIMSSAADGMKMAEKMMI